MGKPKLPENQKRKRHIKAHLTETEYGAVLEQSQKAGLSLSEYSRKVILGTKVESKENHKDIVELLKMNSDLKRLGGLLKLAISEGHNKGAINPVLHQLDLALETLKPKLENL